MSARSSRSELVIARQVVTRLMHEDDQVNKEGAEPWAYNRILDHLEKALAANTDPPLGFHLMVGVPVMLRGGMTGRFIGFGLGLRIDHSDTWGLSIDVADPDGQPEPKAKLPADDAVFAANIMLRYLVPGGYL